MAIELPASAGQVLEQAGDHNFDNAKVLAYKLNGVETEQLQQTCDRATESYARKALKWPDGRLEKPDIFETVERPRSGFTDLQACAEHFIQKLQTLLASDPPHQLPTYYKAFVVASKDEMPDRVAIVLMLQSDEGEWRADSVRCPVEEELGLTITSLTMGDEATEDTLQRLSQ